VVENICPKEAEAADRDLQLRPCRLPEGPDRVELLVVEPLAVVLEALAPDLERQAPGRQGFAVEEGLLEADAQPALLRLRRGQRQLLRQLQVDKDAQELQRCQARGVA
jgi:hypothetical protein